MRTTLIAASFLALLAGPVSAQPMMGPMGDQGMMGHGMMGSCPMMGMMGTGNPHTEGRIAFLKAELKITDAQQSSWKTYADALRAIDQRRASHLGSMGRGMMGGSGPMGPGMMQQGSTVAAPEALQSRIEVAEANLKNLKDLQSATKKLYGELDKAQKAAADDLLGMPCGMGMRVVP